MASFRKRGGSWRAEVRRNNYYESATFATKREAQDWAAQKELEVSKSSGQIVKKTLKDVMLRYYEEIALNNPNHHRAEKNRIFKFLRDNEALANKHIHLIGTEDLEKIRDQRLKEILPSSFLRELTILRSVWKMARKWKNTDTNPFLDFRPPKDVPPRTRIYTQEEVDRLVEALGFDGLTVSNGKNETAVCFLLSLQTGMRSGELLGLKWEHVYLNEQYLHLPKTKNGDSRNVPLSKKAISLLKILIGLNEEKVFRLSDSKRDQYFQQAKRLAEIDGATFHDARATAATNLAKKLSVLELARVLGHRDPRSLMIYYRESASNIAKLLD
ncbi:MAG: site-specific integrase [Advenella sp.]|uniref:tyrosine-type recombinase/integrase n=1 Tax=Advenella sp. TaxID=1872388 RepID=UPI002587BB91|nr:site-specific integrase [Advenella sp.]MDD3759165.1 site-specific integrase [Advenella sp.]